MAQPKLRSISRDHIVETGLSRRSALNDRYFEKESARSRSLDNLLSPVSFDLPDINNSTTVECRFLSLIKILCVRR